MHQNTTPLVIRRTHHLHKRKRRDAAASRAEMLGMGSHLHAALYGRTRPMFYDCCRLTLSSDLNDDIFLRLLLFQLTFFAFSARTDTFNQRFRYPLGFAILSPKRRGARQDNPNEQQKVWLRGSSASGYRSSWSSEPTRKTEEIIGETGYGKRKNNPKVSR